eukprot:TRINITY_DN56892_c0_g1_i1.p1 TRINITY_DN56892_c0_g1~~TRINITY_DN56892_c0_g1_i1.p1  ORF type:complete len:495 (+),score=41.05 TRINITY_DN56892_c0_g1_i1:44-1528(+)
MSYHCMLRVTLSVVFKVFAEAEPLGLQSPEPAAIPSTLVPLSSLPLRTRGRDIVAATSGQRVRLFCVSWYGAHMEEMVVNGLNSQPAEAIANLIVRFGFNCVRLSFSVEMVLSNRTRVPDPDKSLWANPALKDLSPLALYDVVLSALTEAGLLVIMDNHISSAMWCCNTVDGEGLWHTKEYPESAWVEALAVMASRHSKNPRVVAFELRNEIRASPLGKPLWGEGGQELDWSAAAERGARVVVDKKPDLLVVVSGLEFSSNLCDVHRRPIHDVPFLRNRLIYTVHHYPWISVAYFGSVYLTYRIRTVALVCTIISVSFFVVFLLLLVRRLLLRRVVVEAATDPSSEVPSQKKQARSVAVPLCCGEHFSRRFRFDTYGHLPVRLCTSKEPGPMQRIFGQGGPHRLCFAIFRNMCGLRSFLGLVVLFARRILLQAQQRWETQLCTLLLPRACRVVVLKTVSKGLSSPSQVCRCGISLGRLACNFLLYCGGQDLPCL